MAAGSPRSRRSFLSSTLACLLLRPLYRQRSRARFIAASLSIAFSVYETYHKPPTVRCGAHCKLHTRLSRDRFPWECRSRGKNGAFSSELPEALLLLRTPPNNGHRRRYARKRALSLISFSRLRESQFRSFRADERKTGEKTRGALCVTLATLDSRTCNERERKKKIRERERT